MNRLDLYEALWSVLPHCGKPFDVVGIQVANGTAWVWATDGYTIGCVRKPANPMLNVGGFLPKGEALDLARDLRPKNNPQKEELVQLANFAAELHVKVDGELNGSGSKGESSAIYDLEGAGGLSLKQCLGQIRIVWDLPVDGGRPRVLNPDLYSRFAEAKHDSSQTMTFWGRRSQGDITGLGVVTVGDSFVGACIGLTGHTPAVHVVHDLLGITDIEQEDVA